MKTVTNSDIGTARCPYRLGNFVTIDCSVYKEILFGIIRIHICDVSSRKEGIALVNALAGGKIKAIKPSVHVKNIISEDKVNSAL